MVSIMDGSSEIDLDIAVRVDELAEEYAGRSVGEPGLAPEAFAAEQSDVPTEALLVVRRGARVLARAARRPEGPDCIPGESIVPGGAPCYLVFPATVDT